MYEEALKLGCKPKVIRRHIFCVSTFLHCPQQEYNTAICRYSRSKPSSPANNLSDSWRSLFNRALLLQNDKFDFLNIIGRPDNIGWIARRAIRSLRDADSEKMVEAIGLDTVPSENDMKQYIEEVIKEIQANKEKR